MSAQYPDVPNSPGVPPVQRLPGSTPPAPTPPVTGDSADASSASQGQLWGVYDSSMNLAIGADSTLTFGFRGDSTVATAPQEGGAFASYDKVQRPNEIPLTLTKGGSQADRATFLNTIEAIKQSLNLYSIVTPEKTYLNMNLTRYDLERASRAGVTLLTVRSYWEEIRSAPNAQFTQTGIPASFGSTATPPNILSPQTLIPPITNSQQPSARSATNTGAVQAQPPPPSLLNLPSASPPNILNPSAFQ